MSITFGSGQTNGLPVLITAITQGTRQAIHTFPVGSATPERVRINVLNLDTVPHTLYLALEDSGATILRLFSITVPVGGDLFSALSDGDAGLDQEVIANGTATLKAYADTASMLCVFARVDNQSTAVGTSFQNIASGLVASVQNASRYAVNAQGGTGQATEANANIKFAAAGTLRNLRASVDAAVGGGATVTIAVRLNGVTSALSLTFVNADGTADKTDTDSVAVAAGDLMAFLISCDNAGAPAANGRAAVQFIGS